MKYCVEYNQRTEHLRCLKEVDEWTIVYNPKDNTLLEFLSLHCKDVRINIHFKELVDIQFLIDLNEKFPEVYFKLSIDFFDEIKKRRKDIKFKYFYDILVSDWDTFTGLANQNISDIYIVENLGFELDKIAEIAHRNGISVRVFPNVAQSKWKNINSIKKFFIRPEDVELYEPYVDTFEFFGDDKKIDTYYKIYAKDKKWFGQLDEIIIDFHSKIDNKRVIPRFAEKRMRCGKNCLKGGKCNRCNMVLILAKTLENTQMIVKIDKDKKI